MIFGQSLISWTQFGNFTLGFLSSWKGKSKICFSGIISTWLAVYLVNTKVFKRPTCEVTCNLQPNECTVWAAANFESYTMCLVHLKRCGRGLTYEGKSPLQLQGSISGQRAGPRVSSESLIDIDVELRESLCFHQITLFIVLFSFTWARDIWPIIDQLDTVR